MAEGLFERMQAGRNRGSRTRHDVSTPEIAPVAPSRATLPASLWADIPMPMPPWTTGSS